MVDGCLAQAVVDRVGVRAGVQHHRGPLTCAHENGLTLADVAHHDRPVRRWPGALAVLARQHEQCCQKG